MHVIKLKEEYTLPIYYESRGTKALFVELFRILACIDSGTVLVIDEIETGLHPQAVDKIIQYIIDSFSKSKKQFICFHSIIFEEI